MQQQDGGGRRAWRLMTTREQRRWNALNYVLVVAVAVLLFWNVARFVQEREDKEAAQSNAVTLAEQVRAACKDPASSEFTELDPICRQAEKIVENPAQPIIVGPTLDQVREALVAYCLDQPGETCVGRAGRSPADAPELQDPELQDSELQDLELQDPEVNDPDPDDPDPDDPEAQDPEIQDPEMVCPDGSAPFEFTVDGSPPIGLPAGTYLICLKLQ